MKNLLTQGFTIQGTGGGCSAYVKQLATGQYVVITSGCGSSHAFDIDMLVGIYDGSEDEGIWGNMIESFEIDLTKGDEA